MSSATMNTLMTLITAEMPSMSGPELACTMVLAQATIGASRRTAWLTYADFKERTMFSGSTAIANALKAVTARGFFHRCPGQGSNWELGEKVFSLGETSVSQAAALGEKVAALSQVSQAALLAQAFSLGETEVSQAAALGEKVAALTQVSQAALLAQENRSFSGQEAPLARQAPPLTGHDVLPAEEDTQLRGQDAPPAVEDTPPAGQGPYFEANGSTETGLQNGQKSTETVPLPYNKEKDPYGKDLVSREERARAPQNGRPHGPPGGEWGNKDSPSGKGEEAAMPRPRTAAQAALAEHPAARAWLSAGLPWPGWKRLQMITARIGRQPQLDQLSQAWEMWLMAGYRAGNIGGILDWYESLCRDPTWRPFYRTPGHVGAAAQPPQAGAGPPPDPTMAMLLRMVEEEKNGQPSNGYGVFDFADFGLSADGNQRGDGVRLQAGPG